MKKYLCVLIILFLTGCSDATYKNMTTFGESANIKLFSGGILIGEWESTGKVITETQSDGYRFVDKKTGKLIRITGDIIITN
jgi:hypothetical protein